MLVAILVVGAGVSMAFEYVEATAVPRYYLSTRIPDVDGFLAEVRATTPHGIVAMSRDEDVISAGWRYCIGHAQTQPGTATTITVGGRQLTDGGEIRVMARAALAFLCP